MAIIFITGSTDGLGRAAAQSLLDDGHQVVLHARSADRAATIAELASRSVGIVIGDLRSAAETRSIADQVNAIGPMDAVIHNAGVYTERSRGSTPEGHAGTLSVNTLAPYMLTALIDRPARLVYLSSGLHRGGEGSLGDLDWTKRPWDPARAYAESKLHVVALALALARRWPQVLSNAVDPGWARTKMGGPGAPVDLDTGQRTQTWLAASDDPAALVTGRYWHHLRQEQPASESTDPEFQDHLIAMLSELTGVALPEDPRHGALSLKTQVQREVRMKKPYVICLMASSVDGRVLPSRWRPKGAAGNLFERVHDDLAGDAWLVGRVTGQEFAKGKPYPPSTKEAFPREPWFARRDAKAYGVVLDAHGKIGWGRSDIGGDPIVVVLSEKVSDAHLAGLRSEEVSYIFAGSSDLDLALTLDILNRELGVKRLLLEGGGGANGAFLRAGLVDELHLILCPAVDGAKGAPSVFDSADAEADCRAPVVSMTLDDSRALEGGAMLLQYRIQNASPDSLAVR